MFSSMLMFTKALPFALASDIKYFLMQSCKLGVCLLLYFYSVVFRMLVLPLWLMGNKWFRWFHFLFMTDVFSMLLVEEMSVSRMLCLHLCRISWVRTSQHCLWWAFIGNYLANVLWFWFSLYWCLPYHWSFLC